MVTLGIDRIEQSPYASALKNARIGLVTNASGLSPRYGYRGTVEVMASHYNVTALFAPEHGVRGVLGPGEKVSHGVDPLSGIPTYSLFEDMVFAGADWNFVFGTTQNENTKGVFDIYYLEQRIKDSNNNDLYVTEVGYVAKERVDGKLVLPEAVQILKVETTDTEE